MTFKHLRVEETPVREQSEQPVPASEKGVVLVEAKNQTYTRPEPAVSHDLEYWRKLAVQTSERLSYAETQLKDLRTAADDARARFGKYKDRLDKANERVNDQQVQIVRLTADRDDLRGQLAKQEEIARKVHEFRQSILNGPLWDLFVELAVSQPSAGAGSGS